MKKLIILFLLLPSLLFSQVSPSKIERIADANTVFGSALSYGTYLVVQSNNKTYKIISVNGVAGTAKLSDLVLNTDYIEEGTVTSVSTAAANNGVTATWSIATPTPALTIGLGAITPTSVNGLTLTALATGFTVAGGTTSKTLTVPLDASVSGTNTGDQTNITGNAATVTTNANLTGPVTSTGNATAIANGAISNAMLANGAVANLSGTNTGDQTTITGNAGSATNLAGGAGGSIPYQSAAGTTAMLANGTAGQVLQSNGTTLAPSWAAAGAGDMILAGVQTVTGAKTFGTSGGAVGKLIIAGSTSGSTIIDATAVAGSGTVTLPTTGTLATLAGTETLTNKDLTSGNTFPTFNQNTTGNAATVTTNANLTGEVTSVGNAATVPNATVIGKVLTGFTSGAGTVVATDNILQAIQKLDGNSGTNANLTGPITSVGNATSIASQTGTGSTFVMNTSPTLVTPNIGTPSAGVATNLTGTAAGLTSGNVTTNANLTGPVTSTGNATAIANGAISNAMLANTAVANLSGTNTGDQTNITGNAATVTTNANLTGEVTSVGNAATLGSFTSASLSTALTNETGSGAAVFGTSPTLVTPDLGTPSAGVATNLTGTASGLTAGNVTTNANLTGEVTSVGNAATVPNATVIGKVLTGFTSGAGTVAATDNILQAIQKLDGNSGTNANLTGEVTSVGNAATLGSFTSASLATALTNETGTGVAVFATSPTLVTPVLGVATATSINGNTITTGTGTLTLAAGKTLTASNTLTLTGTDGSSVAFGTGGTVAYTENNLSVFAATTSAQLAGVLSDETGTGAAVFGTSPTLATPVINGTITGTTVIPIANGGTNSTTQNWVDLTTVQTAAGAKTWSDAATFSALGTFNLGITSTGAAVNLNASSDFATNINTGTSTGLVTIGGAGIQTISIGNGAAAKTVDLGSSNTTSTTTLLSGSGAINLNVSNNQPSNINTGSSTGTVTIGGTGTQIIAIGDGAGAKTVSLGSLNTTSTTTMLSGSGAINLNASNNQPTNINTGTSTGTVTVGGTGAMQIDLGAGGTGAKAINIGTGAIGNIIAIGTTTGAASLTERIGTGNFSLDGVATSTYIIGSSTIAGTITIGGTAQTGLITIGTSSATEQLDLGNGAGLATVNIANGLAGSAVSIANGANTVAQTVNIGAGASAANNTINIGSGANSAGVTAVTIGSNTNFANTTLVKGGNGVGAITLTPQTTGTIVIGAAAGTGNITLGESTAAQTVLIGNGINTGAQIVSIANGTSGANSTVNILSGVGTAGVGTLSMANNTRVTTIDLGNIAPVAARTTTIAGGGSGVIDEINIGTGAATIAAGKTINIGTTPPTGAGTNSITLGAAGTNNGMGVRFGNGRITMNKPVAPTTGLDANTTATVAQILNAGIIGFTTTANRNLTLPTAQGASGLVQALPGIPAVGDIFTFIVFNTVAGDRITLVAGTGCTIVNSRIDDIATRVVSCRVTSVTPGAETISVY